MGNIYSHSKFNVQGKVVVVTGGSRGFGLEVGRQLAARGAHVVIVGRDQGSLNTGIQLIQQSALDADNQRFHSISADLMSSSEAVRVIAEVEAWNSGKPPDIVWCCAGRAHPTLFIDTPSAQLKEQMDTNYFTAAYMAHATINSWVEDSRSNANRQETSAVPPGFPNPARHLIFTSSLLALYGIPGYSPYSPCKAALRSLSETLSQEVNLYNAAYPKEPVIRLHCIFPSAISTDAHETQNLIKTDLTKMLEGDNKQSPEKVSKECFQGLEKGLELITTDPLGGLVKGGMLGGSLRGGLVGVLRDWFLAWLAGIIMVLVRDGFDKKVRDWGRRYGITGMKKAA